MRSRQRNSREKAKLVLLKELSNLRDDLEAQGKVTVWTNGCFDLLHPGHVRSLQMAKALGDVLIVGINSDESVRRLKGPARPLCPARDRSDVVAALGCVDYVTVFDALTPTAALDLLRPAIFCKGADYAPPSGKLMPEASFVESYGGRIEFCPLLAAYSTSNLIRLIQEGRHGQSGA